MVFTNRFEERGFFRLKAIESVVGDVLICPSNEATSGSGAQSHHLGKVTRTHSHYSGSICFLYRLNRKAGVGRGWPSSPCTPQVLDVGIHLCSSSKNVP